jgi:hypothetical protein
MLPRDLKVQAERRAKELGISLGELIREALETALASNHQAEDSLFADSAVYDGPAPKDGARNHDRYIYGTDYQRRSKIDERHSSPQPRRFRPR